MYRIETEKGELVVSPEHKIYLLEKKKEIRNSLESSSFVCFIEIPTPILNNNSSYVNNLMFLDNARATKSSSLRCLPKSSFALGMNDSYSSNGTNFILLKNILDSSSISELDSLLFSKISDLCLRNSCISFSGAYTIKFSSNKTSTILPFEIKVLNRTLESITTSIHRSPLLTKSSCIDLSTLSDSSLTSSSVNLDLDTIFFNRLRSFDFDLCFMNCTTISDISKEDSSACLFNSLGILTNISAMKEFKDENYKKLSVEGFSLEEVKEVYTEIQGGKLKADDLIFLDEDGGEVRINSIEKVPYSGRIYDVDVPNDVVLVRRGEESYKVGTENGESVVNEGEKIYSSYGSKDYSIPDISNNSLGDKTLTFVCSLRPLSPEKIEQSNLSANARYGESLKFNSIASGNLSMNSEDGMKVICSLISERDSFNSSNVSFDFDNIFPILVSSSNATNSGAINPNLLDILFDSNTSKLFPLFIKAEYITLTSTTSNIYDLFDLSNFSYRFARAIFVSSVNSCTSFSVNSDLEIMRSTLANLSISSLSFLDMNNCQFILFINASSFNSSGMRIVTSAIENRDDLNYINVAREEFRLMPIKEAYLSMQQGEELYFLDENSVPVKVKSIIKEAYSGRIYDVGVSDFELMEIEDVYEELNKGRELWTFDSSGRKVRIDSIEKQEPTAFWSGNSNNGTVVNATPTSSGKFGGGFDFDGVDDTIINMGVQQSLNFTEKEEFTFSAWINTPVTIANSRGLVSVIDGGSTTPGLGVDNQNPSRLNFAFINQTGTTLSLACNSPRVSANTWMHSTGTFNGSLLSIYVNGVLCSSTTVSGLPRAPTGANGGQFWIGGLSGTGKYFNGTIDEVLIFNRSLSAGEIQSLYNATQYKYQNNFTSLSSGTHTFTGFVVDAGGNKNETEERTVTLDFTAPTVTIHSPDNTTTVYVPNVDVNASAIDSGGASVSACLYSIDGAANASMSAFNATLWNASSVSITHGFHNVTVSCNDTVNNWGFATERDFEVNLVDLSIPNIITGTVYPNSTLITINVSNNAPPSATDVNVSCRLDGVLFGSNVLSSISGNTSALTNCTYAFTYSGNYSFNATVDPLNAITESNENNNENNSVINVVIALRNETSVGFVTGLSTVNHNESVYLNATILAGTINTTRNGYNLSNVWVQIARPDGNFVNVTLRSYDGTANGSIWNATYTHPGILGVYSLTYYANLTNGFNYVETRLGNFSAKNTSIGITVGGGTMVVNTTDAVPVSGDINLYNGSTLEDLANNLFLIKLNDVLVSSDRYDDTNFTGGTGTDVNRSNVVKLNLTNAGNLINYNDDYSTNKYTTDAFNYSSIGFTSSGGGIIFNTDSMTSAIGNVTYYYSSLTAFKNATVSFRTSVATTPYPAANTTLWYSYDNSAWTIINSTKSLHSNVTSEIPVNNRNAFYIMLMSDTNGLSEGNPITYYEINYTNYQYPLLGTFNSTTINLPNVTYTVLRWAQNLSTAGSITLQLRESDDGNTWDAWSSNFTNNLETSITSFTKPYLQYRAFLETTNVNVTPVLHAVNISYFNASTNITGGYNYNVTIPTDSLGPQPLQVAVTQSTQGIIGSNTTTVTVWARTQIQRVTTRNYTQPISNYSVLVNFSRTDTGGLTNGTISVNVSNSTYSNTVTCSAKSQCNPSWTIPANLGFGNYTINITAHNESGYFYNASEGYVDFLEQRNTTGTIVVLNKTIGDFQVGTDYSFLWNASVTNTGSASMLNLHVFDSVAARSSGIKSIALFDTCSRVYPINNICNVTMNITVDANAEVGTSNPHFISWRANWSDNDGSVAGGAALGFITYAQMYVIIEGNSSISLTNRSVNLTIQHGNNKTFEFNISSIGSTTVTNVNISYINNGLSSNHIAWNPDFISSILAGQSSKITVNVSIPLQHNPGNFSGIVNVSSANAGELYLNLTVEVPKNTSWTYNPLTNLTYNVSFGLNTAGVIGNITVNNTGNVNISFPIAYSPWGTLYTDYETDLFQTDQVVGSLTMNPSNISVEKGRNYTFVLYQKGRATPLANVGINVRIANLSNSPTSVDTSATFDLEEQPPVVTNVLFLVDNVNTSVAEVNKNVTIKAVATDDINISISLNGTANITLPAGSVFQINVTAIEWVQIAGNKYSAANYTGNFTPSTAGEHNVTVLVYDDAGNSANSTIFSFTAYATTTLSLSGNLSSIIVADADKNNPRRLLVNYTVNNTGFVYAYAPNITFVKNESFVITPPNFTFGNLAAGSNTSTVFEINITGLTAPGDYNVTAYLRHRNPDNTVGLSGLFNVSISVASNKSFDFYPSPLNLTVPSGQSNSTILVINNSGNDLLNTVNLSCYTGTLCGNFTVSFNATNFNISSNNSRNVNVSLTAGAGLTAGYYTGSINVSEQNISEVLSIVATVPETLTWIASPLSVNSSKAAGQSGTLQEVTIENTGNVNLNFTLNTTNNSIVAPNVSDVYVLFGTNASFMINYSAPVTDGNYLANVTISNSTSNPAQRIVLVNLTSTNLNATILFPRSITNNLTNVVAEDFIYVLTNATFEGVVITNSSNWSVTIGGSVCTAPNSTYDSTNVRWNVTCYAPAVTDGIAHNVSITLENDNYGEATDTSPNSVIYRDVTPPVFVNITRNNIQLSTFINLTVNVTDNVEVSSVTASVSYPNLTQVNVSLISLGGSLYNYSGLNLTLVGEYIVNYTTNDTTGNQNSTTDWFEVQNNYFWNTKFVDYSGTGVSGVNITLLRPNQTTVLLNNVSVAGGQHSLTVNKRFYDLQAILSGDKVIVRNVNFTNATSDFYFNLHRVELNILSETIPLYKEFDGIVSNSTNLSGNEVNVIFNYSGLDVGDVGELEVVKCASWNYTARACLGSWSVIDSSRNLDLSLVQGNSTGFSAYFLAENKCGNGLCEATYLETSSTCSQDCVEAQGGQQSGGSSGGGGGGGGGGLSSSDLAKIEELIKSFINVGGVKVETVSIYKELFAGETTTFRIKLVNTLNSENELQIRAEGEPAQFISFPSSTINLAPKEERDVLVTIVIPQFTEPGNYDGDIILSSGEEEASIPVTIKVLPPEGKLLDVKIQPLQSRVEPGEILQVQLDLLNLGRTSIVDVQFDLQLVDIQTGELFGRQEEAFAVETSISKITEFKVPENTPLGKYLLKGTAYYASLEDQNQQATSIAQITVDYPFWRKKYFTVPFWIYAAVVGAIGLLIGSFFYGRYLQFKRKRFKSKVEFNKLPQANAHSGFIGKVAETDVRTFIDLNKLQMHTLVAGSTGSGKTVAAQGIIEAALLKKKSVIVFDPTAQWTGFLRKSQDKAMIKRYKFFGMKTSEIRGFDGSIKTIRDPYEVIDIKKYINRPGEITIFNISHLTPKEIDVVVASTIEQVFRSEPDESKDLKTLIVYDEVHRLLPKFGGTGAGFIQLERGAREFRKWGIGLILISQVLSDFVGEIKANIGTEIQMGTRYEGDLERVNVKYGEDVLKSVVKEPIGTGMFVNAEFNAGRPYFVAFRPLLHSTRRLSNDELKDYEKYFNELEDLEYQILQFKKANVDVIDFNLELKLAKQKVKTGQFQMAELYLETLRPRIEEQWKKLGENPRHIVRKRLNKEVVKEGIVEAKKERAKYIKKNPEKEVSLAEEINKIKSKIEEKKKGGKVTSQVENKLQAIQERLKPFKGKVSEADARGIIEELKTLGKETEEIK